jgi:HEAT repeat protein
LALVAACSPGKVTPMDAHGESRDPEVETQIMLSETPFGDGPHQRERERAVEWLVAHADRAYPHILARLDEGRATEALIQLLPRMGRAESIPRLERYLTQTESLGWAAGRALALHPQPAAGEALRRALANRDPAVAALASDALGTRGDRADCAALLAAAHAPDARLRYHAVQAAGKLGCFDRKALESLAQFDADADVRGLAAELLKAPPSR